MQRFTIVPADAADQRFAHDISRENMEKYYAALGQSWDPALIRASWPATENFSILAHDVRIGILRLRPDADAIYISDLQIAAGSQGRGAGACALQFVERLGRERGLTRIRLRAFTGSPAVRLYERAGFARIADETTKQLFEKAI